MASASAQVVASGTVGPLAITAGSSPGTSLISSVTTRAGAQQRRQPPALDAPTGACARSSSRRSPRRFQQRAVDRLLVGQRQPSAGQGQQGRAAAGDQAQDQVVGSARRQRQDALRAACAGGVGHRVRRLDHLDAAVACRPAGCGGSA
jgi:hypothetical protein